MTIKYYIGIDPGINGGLACLNSNGDIVKLDVMPVSKFGNRTKLDIPQLSAWLKECYTTEEVRMVAIEEQTPMHKQGLTSTFSIGRGFGILEGVVSALKLPYEVIRPHYWQKSMFAGYPKQATKDLSKKVARQLFPKEEFKKSARCTNLHDGLTDAVLIAEYIRRKIK